MVASEAATNSRHSLHVVADGGVAVLKDFTGLGAQAHQSLQLKFLNSSVYVTELCWLGSISASELSMRSE